MAKYYAITERRSEEAKRIRREYSAKYGKDFSPRRGKVIVPRTDDVANCVTATQTIEQYLLVDQLDTEAIPLTQSTATTTQPTQKQPFKYIELFAGIGGFRQALDQLGGSCVFASEIDKFATQSYNALYGEDAHLHGDITQVEAADVPDHDVLVGGFPCQAFSVAGKRQGFADKTRGTLFFDVVRIAAEKQPRLIVLENVKGLVGHDKGRTLDTIVESFNAAGYHVDFNVLNSKYFGVPQNRERIFIVALRDDVAQTADWRVEGTNVVAKGKRRIAGYGVAKTFNFDWPAQGDVKTRLRDVLEASVDERYYLSDEKTAALVDSVSDRRNITDLLGENVRPFNTTADGQVYAVISRTPQMYLPVHVEKSQATLVEETNPRYRIRKLTPLECWRLQGFPDAAHDAVKDAGVSDSQRYKQAGNAVTVNVIAALGAKLLPLVGEQVSAE